MPKEQPEKRGTIERPKSPDITSKTIEQWNPEQLNPDLANLAMARILVDKMGTPSIVNKQFVVRKAVFEALNHIPGEYRVLKPAYQDDDGFWIPAEVLEISKGNITGYDSSLRIKVYREAEKGSVNIEGRYFEKIWAFLMKPKYIINSVGGMPGQFGEEEKGESLIGRAWNWFRGGKKTEQQGSG